RKYTPFFFYTVRQCRAVARRRCLRARWAAARARRLCPRACRRWRARRRLPPSPRWLGRLT
ncbi:unnamed protein product, partial [Leptidea sinapis]